MEKDLINIGEMLSEICKENVSEEDRKNFNYVEYEVNKFNKSKVHSDVFECDKCGNKGLIAYKDMYNNVQYKKCECYKIRKNREKMKKIGLLDFISIKNDNLQEPKEAWETKMLSIAKEFQKDDNNYSIFYGGAVGCGKTTICAKIMSNKIDILSDLTADYIVWDISYKDLIFNDPNHDRLNEIKNVGILFIDDFLRMGRIKELNENEREIAKSIIDYRYRNKLITIITSELYLNEIIDIDEAIGTRIYEMCNKGKYVANIKREESRNRRKKKELGIVDKIKNISVE